MRIGELARRAGVSAKTVRYYEKLGLIEGARSTNGYRDFAVRDVRAVTEIKQLIGAGLTARETAPFLECLDLGHEHGDDCVASLAVYRDTIAALDRKLAFLALRRQELADRLHRGASRTFDRATAFDMETTMTDYTFLPVDLPVPEDDGAAAHLPGTRIPDLVLPTAGGQSLDLGQLGPGRTVLYLYPLTGQPGVDLPDGWDSIPGARGCSTEACDFRDHFAELREAGVQHVFGMSSQSADYQAEVVDRLHLPFTMISDEEFALGDALRLPTFSASGQRRLYSRLTLVISDQVVEHVFYPIFPPNTHAQQVLGWVRANAGPDPAATATSPLVRRRES